MFTGIVTDIGRISAVEQRGDARVVVETGYDTATIDLGASIACSGVCLTVTGLADERASERWFEVEAWEEALRLTTAGAWGEGTRINLERALLGDELGGHIVTGHVDGVAHIEDVSPDGDSKRIAFRVDPVLAPFLAPKGSVTVDGVSLTVNAVEDRADATRFTVNVIPHTQGATTLGALAVGHSVNIEIDVLARYLQRMEHYRGR